ncbi:MAG: hypothetical protein KY469_00135 [Actinobacteria bacterium]|nr:hypothetical protein [Actinomycetota bacterium]
MMAVMETFIVRIWSPAGDVAGGDGGLHGTVERVGSGAAVPFRSSGELLELVTFRSAPDADDVIRPLSLLQDPGPITGVAPRPDQRDDSSVP